MHNQRVVQAIARSPKDPELFSRLTAFICQRLIKGRFIRKISEM